MIPRRRGGEARLLQARRLYEKIGFLGSRRRKRFAGKKRRRAGHTMDERSPKESRAPISINLPVQLCCPTTFVGQTRTKVSKQKRLFFGCWLGWQPRWPLAAACLGFDCPSVKMPRVRRERVTRGELSFLALSRAPENNTDSRTRPYINVQFVSCAYKRSSARFVSSITGLRHRGFNCTSV